MSGATNSGKNHNRLVIDNNHEEELFFIRVRTATHTSHRIVHFIEFFNISEDVYATTATYNMIVIRQTIFMVMKIYAKENSIITGPLCY